MGPTMRFLPVWLGAIFWHSSHAQLTETGGASPLISLAPDLVWKHFDQIRQIPRCSGNEGGSLEYVRSVAARAGLTATTDSARNLVVKRPATNAGRGAAPVIVQTHLDMVCEKSADSRHDFDRDSVEVAVKDGWVMAETTTLGADNGIGVSMALALLQTNNSGHLPPLEFVFTVREESGLEGAAGLDVSLLTGRRLLNFDSEEHGIVYIGSAGGGDVSIDLPITVVGVPAEKKQLTLKVQGLQGGHSGVDIHLGRGNAVLIAARAVAALFQEISYIKLAGFEGGNLDNAIPREAIAHLFIGEGDLEAAGVVVARMQREFRSIFSRTDPALEIHLGATVQQPELQALTDESASKFLDLLLILPHGPIRHSAEVPGLVETSNNVARVRRTSPNTMEILCFARSSSTPSLAHVRDSMRRAAERMGASATLGVEFPGWAPNSSSTLLQLTLDVFQEYEGQRPEIRAIHAGLECGVIGNKIPGIDMVSYGPDIVGAHAPGERVRIESVARTWQATENLMVRIAHLDDRALPGIDSDSMSTAEL